MKLTLLSLVTMSLLSCRTTAGYSGQNSSVKEASSGPSASANQPETKPTADVAKNTPKETRVILRKVVGALSKEDPKAQHYDCAVKESDIGDLEKVEKWLAELEKAPLLQAYMFRATVPSMQYFGYIDGREILIYESYSTMRYRKPPVDTTTINEMSDSLLKIANSKCPYPS